MLNQKQTIAIVGPSQLIQLGLTSIIRDNSGFYNVHSINDLQGLHIFFMKHTVSTVIIDAGIISSNQKLINSLRKEQTNCTWIALVYQYIKPSVISQFDDVITIDQSSSEIMSVISSSHNTEERRNDDLKTEMLSDRETDVLKLLVTGFSAKEIADKLNISVNTVISHRKNISQKTGIKSLAGLTIYAVTNKVILMSNLQR